MARKNSIRAMIDAGLPGDEEKLFQLLDKVINPDLIEVKEKFLAEINNKNEHVFQLF